MHCWNWAETCYCRNEKSPASCRAVSQKTLGLEISRGCRYWAIMSLRLIFAGFFLLQFLTGFLQESTDG